MSKKKHTFTEQEDNVICTFVRLYHFNIAFGLRRASQYTAIKHSLVLARYYRSLRNHKKIFVFNYGSSEIWNTKVITHNSLMNISEKEPTMTIGAFEELERRVWWGD